MITEERTYFAALLELDELHGSALQTELETFQIDDKLRVRWKHVIYELIDSEELTTVQVLHESRELIAIHIDRLVIKKQKTIEPFQSCSCGEDQFRRKHC